MKSEIERVEEEYNIINRRMEKNLEMRHTYLMFAFTTSIAAIAALYIAEVDGIGVWACIVPYAIIIPFQARISYSRLTHAKMEAYLLTHYSDQMMYLKIPLNELKGGMGRIIALIANYELTLLSIAIDAMFMFSKVQTGEDILKIDTMIMMLVTVVVFALATYTYSYSSFLEKYKKVYRENLEEQH